MALCVILRQVLLLQGITTEPNFLGLGRINVHKSSRQNFLTITLKASEIQSLKHSNAHLATICPAYIPIGVRQRNVKIAKKFQRISEDQCPFKLLFLALVRQLWLKSF